MAKYSKDGTARAVRTCRAWAGMTMAELAAHVGVAWQTVSAWERGKQEPSMARAGRVAEACRVPFVTFHRWAGGEP